MTVRRIPITSPENQKEYQLKYQIYPAKEIKSPNDTAAQELFGNLPENLYKLLAEQGLDGDDPYPVDERDTRTYKDKNTQKMVQRKKVVAVTKIWIELINGYNDLTPLNEYDRAVLGACMAEQQKSNPITTPSIIYRNITGSEKEPTKKQIEDIMRSIDKLMFTRIKIDASDTYKKLSALRGKTFDMDKFIAPILPGRYGMATINGKPNCIAIEFYDTSPVFQLALDKGQIITLPSSILATRNVSNTKSFLVLKEYISIRIAAIKRGHLTPTILFNSLYQHCGFTVQIHKKHFKTRIREAIQNYMECLIEKGEIMSYELSKEVKKSGKWVEGKEYTKLKFTYNQN